MTVATIELSGDALTLQSQDARAATETRRLSGADFERVARWSADYRRALLTPDKREPLRALGREMFAWIDGERGWLRRVRMATPTALCFEVSVPPSPSPDERAFLEAPWELLADSRGHLTEQDAPLFVPSRRLGRRGAPARPSESRLSVLLMVAGPAGVAPLYFEEEEAAILDAAGAGVDLQVEDSGSLEELARRLGARPIDVLHLCCHGTSDDVPRLLLEDELGQPSEATAEALAAALDPGCGAKLLFVSACLGGDPHAVSGSLAAAMTGRGWPAVLAWGGSVSDAGATRFARHLYAGPRRGQSLEEAIARARGDLLHHPKHDVFGRCWHLARLYLGAHGGGALTRPAQPLAAPAAPSGPSSGAPHAGAPREMVGRRRHVQAALREMRRPTQAGVLVLGLPGHGKSSLAKRIAARLPAHVAVTLRERYDWPALVAALEAALPSASQHLAPPGEPPPADDAERAGRLRRLVEAPGPPLLFLLDDIDRALGPIPKSGLPELRADQAEALRALLLALDARCSRSRLLVTSRRSFALPWPGGDLAERLVPLHLGAMSPFDAMKVARAWERACGPLDPRERAQMRFALHVAAGNPALLTRLLERIREDPDRLDRALEELDAHHESGAWPDDPELRAFLEGLEIEPALSSLTQAERHLLRAGCVIGTDAPLEVFRDLERVLGLGRASSRAPRLLALGLVDGLADSLRPGRASAMVSLFVRRRLEPLDAVTQRELCAAAVKRLGELWPPQVTERPSHVAEELARLAVAGRDARAARRHAEPAVRGMFERDDASLALAAGLASIELLDEQGSRPSIGLLQVTAEAGARLGEIDVARRLFDRALSAAEAASKTGALQPIVHAGLLVAHARFADEQGREKAARAGYDRALALLAGDGLDGTRAAIEGEIAGMLRRAGALDEALDIHRRTLAVLEARGDTAGRAAAMMGAALVLADRADADRALDMLREAARLFETACDARRHAVALGHVARLLHEKGDSDEALRLCSEVCEVHELAGNRREHARSLRGIAEILASRGRIDEALALRRRALHIFEAIGDRRERAGVLDEIADLLEKKGAVATAAPLRAKARSLRQAFTGPPARERGSG